MRKAIRNLSMFGRKAFPTSWPAIATLTVLLVGGVLPHSAAAQASPQILATQARVKPAISPEALAMHTRAKRPVAAAPTN